MVDTTSPDDCPSQPQEQSSTLGQKPPLNLRGVWTVRTRLQMAGNTREVALFNLAIDNKLRGCDLVRLGVRNPAHGSQVLARAAVVHVVEETPWGPKTSSDPRVENLHLKSMISLMDSRTRICYTGLRSSVNATEQYHACFDPPIASGISGSTG